MTRTRRRTAAAVAVAVLGVLLGGALTALVAMVSPVSANAASYRYWTYWWGAGTGSNHSTSWRFASQGPASHPVADGWVLGWRFATTSVAGGAAPRTSAGFDALCPGMAAAPAGSVRVALVVDYGTQSDAPPGQTPPTTSHVQRQCLVVPSNARGTTVLSAAKPAGIAIRQSDNGLICALNGYPRGECAPIVADPVPTPKPTSARPTPTRTSAGASAAARPSSSARSTGGASSPPTATASQSPGAPSSSPSASSTTAVVTGPPGESPLPLESDVPQASGDAGTSGGSSPVPAALGVAVVAVVAGGAWWSARTRGGSS